MFIYLFSTNPTIIDTSLTQSLFNSYENLCKIIYNDNYVLYNDNCVLDNENYILDRLSISEKMKIFSIEAEKQRRKANAGRSRRHDSRYQTQV